MRRPLLPQPTHVRQRVEVGRVANARGLVHPGEVALNIGLDQALLVFVAMQRIRATLYGVIETVAQSLLGERRPLVGHDDLLHLRIVGQLPAEPDDGKRTLQPRPEQVDLGLLQVQLHNALLRLGRLGDVNSSRRSAPR